MKYLSKLTRREIYPAYKDCVFHVKFERNDPSLNNNETVLLFEHKYYESLYFDDPLWEIYNQIYRSLK